MLDGGVGDPGDLWKVDKSSASMFLWKSYAAVVPTTPSELGDRLILVQQLVQFWSNQGFTKDFPCLDKIAAHTIGIAEVTTYLHIPVVWRIIAFLRAWGRGGFETWSTSRGYRAPKNHSWIPPGFGDNSMKTRPQESHGISLDSGVTLISSGSKCFIKCLQVCMYSHTIVIVYRVI